MRCQTCTALLSSMLMVLCTSEVNSHQTVTQESRSEITEQQAIEIARREIARRGLSLPKHRNPWAAAVFSDTEPVRPVYWVVFAPPTAAEKGIQVMVDRESGKVVDFLNPRTFIIAQAAIEIAKKELSRRGISLPKNWGVAVEQTPAVVEFRPELPLFTVWFYLPGKDKRSAIYDVAIEARTGKVYSFSDNRMTIAPSGEIRLKGIGKEHIKSLENTLAKEKRFRGVQIHTSKTEIISITPPPGMSEHDKADLERLIRREVKGTKGVEY